MDILAATLVCIASLIQEEFLFTGIVFTCIVFTGTVFTGTVFTCIVFTALKML